MKLVICTVLDDKTAQYGRPFFEASSGSAIRAVSDEVNGRNQGDSPISRHPGDFSLFVLGEFDTELGVFDAHPPRLLMACSDMVVKAG